jgi:exonuclease SbcC
MQLHRLRLLNFRQHADTEIAFGPGITGIIGPNGTGKTTLLEAIAWAFYGNPAARGSKETIRWNRAPARSSVRVEVDFSLGPHEFRVVRGLYNAELFQDRFDQPTANSQQEVSAKVERLLGMTREEFFNTYFTGQKELAVMAAMGATERARFLSRVLGYEKLRLTQDRVREARSGLRGELAGLERGLADAAELTAERDQAAQRTDEATKAVAGATAAHATAGQTLEAEGPAWTRMVEVRESALALDGERRIAERDEAEARREFDRLDKELAEALGARAKLEELGDTLRDVEPLKQELERLEHEASSAGRRRALAGQHSEVREQAERVRERMEKLGDVEGALVGAQSALDEARKRLTEAEAEEEKARTAWVRDKQDAETKTLSLRDQYKDHQTHRHSVVKAGPDGECPICKRPLGDVYQEMLETIDRQLEEIEVKGKFFRQRMEQLEAAPGEVRDAERLFTEATELVERAVQEVARCEDRVQEYRETESERRRLVERAAELERELAALPDRYDAERHDAVRERLRELQPAIDEAAVLNVKAAHAEQLVGEAEAAERTLSEREVGVKALEAAIADLGFSEDAYAEARRRYEAAEGALREAELHLASVQGDLKAAETALDGAARRIREREERAQRIEQTRTELQLHDELDRALHDLRLELNTAMRPELSERASEFLASLTDGRYDELELDESYDLLVVEGGEAKPVISGGEEDLTHLVLRLAISQMVAERAGQPLSLLVLDEIFGSLDEHRRQNVVQLLRGLADRFPQVVLITHIDSVREGVDRVLRVELDENRGAAVVVEDQTPNVGEDVAA